LADEYVIEDKKKQLLVIVIICLVGFLVTYDYASLNISLSVIASHFKVRLIDVAWLPTIYLLIITSLLLGFGKLADIVGYKKIFLVGVSGFAVGGFLCAISPTFHTLLLARTFQSCGQAVYSPMEIVLITAFLPQNIRGRAFGLYAMFQGFGMVAGSLLGGYINSVLNWRYNFVFSITAGIFVVLLSLKVLPWKHIPPAEKRFDLPGAALLFFALGALLYAVNSMSKPVFDHLAVFSFAAASLILFAVFFFREKTAPAPLLDLKLFKNLDFTFSVGALFLVMALVIGFIFLFPFYLEMVRSLDIAKAGLIMTFPSVLMMLIAPVAGILSDRMGCRRICVAGAALILVAFIMLSFVGQNSPDALIALALLFLGMGMGLFIAPNNKLVMGHVPAGRHGVGSGVYKICANAGSSMGLAVLVLITSQIILFNAAKMHILFAEVREHPDIAITGFRGAFAFGVLLSVIALVLASLAKDAPQHGE